MTFPLDYFRRRTGQRAGIKTDQRHRLGRAASEKFVLRVSHIERRGPCDTLDRAYTVNIRVPQRLIVADLLHKRIHHPNRARMFVAAA